MVPQVEALIRDRKLDAPFAIAIVIGTVSTCCQPMVEHQYFAVTYLTRARQSDLTGEGVLTLTYHGSVSGENLLSSVMSLRISHFKGMLASVP